MVADGRSQPMLIDRLTMKSESSKHKVHLATAETLLDFYVKECKWKRSEALKMLSKEERDALEEERRVVEMKKSLGVSKTDQETAKLLARPI